MSVLDMAITFGLASDRKVAPCFYVFCLLACKTLNFGGKDSVLVIFLTQILDQQSRCLANAG